MKYYSDLRFDMSNGASLFIYFEKCNMKCSYCDHIKMIEKLPTSTLEEIIEMSKLINVVGFSGGEALLYTNDLRILINSIKMKYKDMKFVLYSNVLLLDKLLTVIDYFDNVYIDVKGFTVEEVMNNSNLNDQAANKLLKNYNYLMNNYKNKCVFRINQFVNIDNIKTDANIIEYIAI